MSSDKLSHQYNYISPSYGDSFILKKDDGTKIIISPFEDESGSQLVFSTISSDGEVKQKTIYINSFIYINYILHYWNGSKEVQEKL